MTFRYKTALHEPGDEPKKTPNKPVEPGLYYIVLTRDPEEANPEWYFAGDFGDWYTACDTYARKRNDGQHAQVFVVNWATPSLHNVTEDAVEYLKQTFHYAEPA